MNPNRMNETVEVLARLKNHPALAVFQAARVVGRWVWLEFDSKPAAEIRTFLKEEGFHWNRKRSAWQHPCGFFSRSAPYNPKDKYGEINAADAFDLQVEDNMAAACGPGL